MGIKTTILILAIGHDHMICSKYYHTFMLLISIKVKRSYLPLKILYDDRDNENYKMGSSYVKYTIISILLILSQVRIIIHIHIKGSSIVGSNPMPHVHVIFFTKNN